MAIDGPSGSGKSSVSRAIARMYGFGYLDTGAMYRALTWWALHGDGVPSHCQLEISTDPDNPRVLVGSQDVTTEIRGPEVTDSVSKIASDHDVRRVAVELQRAAIAGALNGIVVEGRDITTVVAPDADVRIFLTADLSARELRRAAEFQDPEVAARMRSTVAARDAIDTTRAHSPLMQAEGVATVDATYMTLDEVIAEVRNIIEKTIEKDA